jgi:hypothetical protein
MTTATSTRDETIARRRVAEARLWEGGARLAGRLGRSWPVPRRQWDLEQWRAQLLEAAAELLAVAADGSST